MNHKTIQQKEANKSSNKDSMKFSPAKTLMAIGIAGSLISIGTETVGTYYDSVYLSRATAIKGIVRKADPPNNYNDPVKKTLNTDSIKSGANQLKILKRKEDMEDAEICANISWGAVAGLVASMPFLLIGMAGND